MGRIRPWLLALSLAGSHAVLSVPTPAHAQSTEPIPVAGLIELLPPGQVTGDGASAHRLYVIALGPSGAPNTDLDARLVASRGAVSGWSHQGNGVYHFDYRPERVAERTPVQITLRGRGADRARFERVLAFDVVPPLAHEVRLAMPAELVVGEDLGTDLSISLSGGSGQPLDSADVVLRASEGEVKALKSDGGGAFSARYVPKKVNYPHIALLTAADVRQPFDARGYTVVRMAGKVDYPILAPAGAEVTLDVGGKRFGPVVAGPGGRAEVPIVVRPGVTTGTVITVTNGETTSTEIDLRVPETRRIVLFPTPTALPADAATGVPLRALVRTPAGLADTEAKVVFDVAAGTVSEARHLADGVYEATWTLPIEARDGISVAARIDGQDVQLDTLMLDLVPALPDQVRVVPDPPVLAPGGTRLGIVATPLDADGSPRPDARLAFVGGGAKLDGEAARAADGTVRATFLTNPTGPVEVLTRPMAEPSGNPLRHLVIVPSRDRLTNDGLSGVPVAVIATDAFGLPVPGVSVTLDVVGADGTITPSVTTDANGVGLALFTAGRTAGFAGLRGRFGNLHAAAAVAQLPAEVPPIAMPLVGGPAQVAIARRWRANVVLTRVEHGGEAASGWTSVAPLPEAEAPAATETATDHPVSPRPPSPGAVEPALRLRASYVLASYGYQQVPNGTDGPLLGQTFAIGGESGGKNALPQGFEANARGWLPPLPYLGVQVQYRAALYGISAEIFGDQIVRDTLHDLRVDVLGRYFFDVDRSRLHVGARAGLRVNDFIYFTEERTDTQVIYAFNTLLVPSLSVGPELGADFGRAFTTLGADFLLAYGSTFMGFGLDGTVGVHLTDHVYVDLGVEYLDRQLDVIGAETRTVRGTLDDTLLLGRVGLGVAF